MKPQNHSPRDRRGTWGSPRDHLSSSGVGTVASSPPTTVSLLGRSFIPPSSTFARVVMGNEPSAEKDNRPHNTRQQNMVEPQRASNLTVLMSQHNSNRLNAAAVTKGRSSCEALMSQHNSNRLNAAAVTKGRSSCEADSASGPPPVLLGSSAPSRFNSARTTRAVSVGVPTLLARQHSTGAVSTASDRVRRCISSKELGTLAPPSGSPYAYMIYKKEQLEMSMRKRFQAMREAAPERLSDESSSTSSRRKEGANELRNRRRAQHNQAITEDLCNVVSDLFIAESKLIKPNNYGVPDNRDVVLVEPSRRSVVAHEQVFQSVRNFVTALPVRYALSVDTPSEVLLHMRLMAAARADKTKAAVHIHKVDSEYSTRNVPSVTGDSDKLLRLVTITCNDATGLLEYITRLLATGGSRVLDADVMLSTDGIVLDRFVVEMNGRLRLDRLANSIESFIREKTAESAREAKSAEASVDGSRESMTPTELNAPLYYKQPFPSSTVSTPNDIRLEMQGAVPLSAVLASQSYHANVPDFPKLRKLHSMPPLAVGQPALPSVQLKMRNDPQDGVSITLTPDRSSPDAEENPAPVAVVDVPNAARGRRPLVNRRGSSNLDEFGTSNDAYPLDFVTIPRPLSDNVERDEGRNNREVPLIPFDELMLIETLGTGRVSTIYRAAWQSGIFGPSSPAGVRMVALKVAMINNITGDTSHVDELRREADIAARLSHPNICDLVGVAADHECFCLAYDFCEGGSLLSLLQDPSRYYEYLPIAMDIANGMAYLHSRNLIHRDLKPSNVLLTRDHRGKIADFGMSVAYTGQELTAETGTYRYMAPEVIRHESYSSNADVYSFGICLWQLISREIPFATMTPIQAAYAVAEGRRPTIPPSTPRRLQEIIVSCWDQDSHRRPSFTYIALALADYAKMAFSPANVGALTLQIANEMLAKVEGNSTVNVDFSTPVAGDGLPSYLLSCSRSFGGDSTHSSGNVGLEIE